MKEIFEGKYKQLNKEQKEAVDTIEGPVMVVAGPGTGKTQILTLRIANILLKTDTNPENILAITFTEAGAAAMRTRLFEIIGSIAYRVNISTFHGFCNSIIKEYQDEFPNIISARNSTEVEVAQIIESIISNGDYKELRPFGDEHYYVKSILGVIANIKKEGVSPEEFSVIVVQEKEKFSEIPDLFHTKGPHTGKMKGEYQILEKQIRKTEELARLYKEYRNAQKKLKIYDFEDMILEVLAALQENKNFLQVLQERFQYVLIDEHQDTNNGQNKVIELLMNYHENPNIFVVGDEKQAIFRFQGASLENFLYFQKQYKVARLIILHENYRSTQTILDSAHSVLAGQKPLNANAGYNEKLISVRIARTAEEELLWVASDIKKKIEQGILARDIAVLYRDNKDAERLLNFLDHSQIPARIYTEGDAMQDRDIQKLFVLLRSINALGSDELLARTLHIDFLGLEPLDIYKCLSAQSSLSLCDRIRSREFLKSVAVGEMTKLLRVGKLLSQWKAQSMNKTLPEFFEILIHESGFLDYILSGEDSIRALSALEGVFGEIKASAERHSEFSLNDFLLYLDTIKAHNIRIKNASLKPQKNEVQCMTAHKSKGLEFSCVYVIHAYNGHWGNRRARTIFKIPQGVYMKGNAPSEDSNDERRLFYVAITRAKKEIVISYPELDFENREVFPCEFITEINKNFLDVSHIESNSEKPFELIQKKRKSLKDEELVRHLFSERGISATSLNNYLECPWRYFYSNLLRIPSAMTKFQVYGNIIHLTLQDFFIAFRESDKGEEFLLSRFSYHLMNANIRDNEKKELEEKGNRALPGYYRKFHSEWIRDTRIEFPIRGIFLTPEIRLTGKIDKIEIFDTKNEVNVVDYKTEKPKSRNEIEGNTKNSKGNIKRQLVFYKLLLDEYDGVEKFKFASGQIDFVEPDEKGNYHIEQFVITDGEVSELKKEIIRVANEIQSLAFWDLRCEDKECKYCALRELL
ncbi:MAG: ATP-dependent DNA helicase [Candidatus Paceibacterota bacterium]|jgi:DNA helicase-2/ATP-dependent DNA helicase PcrA